MKLYKRMMKITSTRDGGMGFRTETAYLTNWLEEEEGELELIRIRKKADEEGWWATISYEEKFEVVENR